MTITPDTKDWTWVLERRCEECGFDSSEMDPTTAGAVVRSSIRTWQTVLRSDAAEVRTRPRPDTWSALEYACHVRDVFAKFDGRLALILSENDPSFDNWDQDASAVEGRYDEQQPESVAGQLAEHGLRLAARFDSVTDADWQRTGRRSDGAVFTTGTFARYLVHDLVHHVYDVTGRQYADQN